MGYAVKELDRTIGRRDYETHQHGAYVHQQSIGSWDGPFEDVEMDSTSYVHPAYLAPIGGFDEPNVGDLDPYTGEEIEGFKKLKKLRKKGLKVAKKVAKKVLPVVAAAGATYFAGPAAGAAVYRAGRNMAKSRGKSLGKDLMSAGAGYLGSGGDVNAALSSMSAGGQQGSFIAAGNGAGDGMSPPAGYGDILPQVMPGRSAVMPGFTGAGGGGDELPAFSASGEGGQMVAAPASGGGLGGNRMLLLAAAGVAAVLLLRRK
jgi:hypothetical protein